MYLKSFRLIAIIVLLAVISMFTGLETVFSAAPVEKAAKSCCDGCGHDENQEGPASQSVPQSTPDCPAFMCLSFNVVEPVTLQVIFTEIIPSFAFIPAPIPDPLLKSIFKPPRLV